MNVEPRWCKAKLWGYSYTAKALAAFITCLENGENTKRTLDNCIFDTILLMNFEHFETLNILKILGML